MYLLVRLATKFNILIFNLSKTINSLQNIYRLRKNVICKSAKIEAHFWFHPTVHALCICNGNEKSTQCARFLYFIIGVIVNVIAIFVTILANVV